MELQFIDWLVIGIFLSLIIGISLRYTQQAGKNIESFFLGARNLPWWIAGTSMVATTFAADTPLLITELVANNGISGNWLWWNGLIGGMLTAFFFSKLWRRAQIVTDVELIELRFKGKPAAYLRGFKAVYFGLFLNAVIIAWVNLALMALLEVFFGCSMTEQLIYAGLAMLIVAIYTSLSGLTGVAITDFLQFLVAMGGCIALAFIVLDAEAVGGIQGLKDKLPEASFSFFPRIGDIQDSEVYAIGFTSFFAFVGLQWWASWYPGSEPGGGGYVAQRMMSTKDEVSATKATLLFQIAHIALRPWPWIIVALAAAALYPDLPADSKRLGYVMAMKDFLPPGLKGLLLAAFFAAYMSTISTQLNWGASYLVNDLYARFVAPKATDRQIVSYSRLATVLVMVAGLLTTIFLDTMEGAFLFMISCGAGLGLVLILRWYWWRVNAYSEITATVAPFIPMAVLSQFPEIGYPNDFFITVAFTTVAWITVTFLTRPTDRAHLQAFYKRVHPPGAWMPIRKSLGLKGKGESVAPLFLQWIMGIVLGYSVLFGIGEALMGSWAVALVYFAVAAGSAYGISRMMGSKAAKVSDLG